MAPPESHRGTDGSRSCKRWRKGRTRLVLLLARISAETGGLVCRARPRRVAHGAGWPMHPDSSSGPDRVGTAAHKLDPSDRTQIHFADQIEARGSRHRGPPVADVFSVNATR